MPRASMIVLALASAVASACTQAPQAKEYPLTGQVLAVHPEQQQLTIKHADIPGYMPGMTMSFPVAAPALMNGREPGELVTATLSVADAVGRLTAITRTGMAPLPQNTNELALATGILGIGDAVPDAAFIDQTDTRRSFAEWKGSLTVLTFSYTRCPLPTFCPLMDQNFATLQGAIAEDPALTGKVKLVTISFDPMDTPAVLAAHAKKRQADPAVWTFLTGDKATVDKFAGRFGVGVITNPQTPTDITHNLRTALIGADGRITRLYSGSDWTPSVALADLRDLAAKRQLSVEQARWLAAAEQELARVQRQ
jgi:protein SCO1/2